MNRSNAIISVKDVSMRFNLNRDKNLGIKEFVIKKIRRQIAYDEFWALKGISFEVRRGEVFGVMGLNGSGKSTLLKIIANVFKPTKGTVSVRGEIAPLLELGAGFDPEISARENIIMNGAMFGHSPKYMEQRYEEIIDFAELWEFADVPLKNFSSGMKARLGFSVATRVNPDILIIDEVLSVGDHLFKKKCGDRIEQMISDDGVTVLIVSHDAGTLKKMCSRALLLEKGEMACIGPVDEVCRAYGEN